MTIVDMLRNPNPYVALVIIAIAGVRWAFLLVSDTITEGLRHRLFLRIPIDETYARYHRDRSDATGWRYHADVKPRRHYELFGALVSCPWCVSTWTTAATLGTWSLPLPTVALVVRVVHLLGALTMLGWIAASPSMTK